VWAETTQIFEREPHAAALAADHLADLIHRGERRSTESRAVVISREVLQPRSVHRSSSLRWTSCAGRATATSGSSFPSTTSTTRSRTGTASTATTRTPPSTGAAGDEPPTLCVSCHGSLGEEMARQQLHQPVGNFLCTSCHHPHASEWSGILTMRQRDLCFSCHPSVAWLSNKAVQHQPFEYDNCTGCHEPHGSDYQPLLIDAEPDRVLRLPCRHRERLPPGQHPSRLLADARLLRVSQPARGRLRGAARRRGQRYLLPVSLVSDPASYQRSATALLCVRCHTPHGSEWKPILREANPDICLQCHSWVESHDNQHPVRPQFYDIRADAPLTCTSTCHGPHGTEFPMMVRFYPWPFDGRCLQCHSTVGIDF
jgi:predicted CXXCH cytochrome family protein